MDIGTHRILILSEANFAAALTTASGGYNTYTCVIDQLTNKLTVSASNSFQLKVYSVTNNCGALLGFSVDPAAGTIVTSDVGMNLSPIKSYNIIVNDNNQNIFKVSSGRWYSLHIPPAVVSNDVQIYEPTTFQQYVTFKYTNQVRISVYDDSDTLIPLTLDWSMLFEKV